MVSLHAREICFCLFCWRKWADLVLAFVCLFGGQTRGEEFNQTMRHVLDVLCPVVGRETNANPARLVGRQEIKLLKMCRRTHVV